MLEKDLYYYKKTSRDLKKKLREKMAAGTGARIESDVLASGELEPQYGTIDAHGRQLATEVSRMKVGCESFRLVVKSESTPCWTVLNVV